MITPMPKQITPKTVATFDMANRKPNKHNPSPL